MDKLDPKTDGSSKDIVQENIVKLKEIFPEVFTESKVDFEKLKESLGDYAEGHEERYSFSWHGKSRAKRIAQTPSTGTLRPCKEESKNWDTTQNLFIEGDNLEVLKLLQKSYHRKIKMIYIDPPYNTGKEFIYPDNYKDNLDTYLRYTGQIDNDGYKFSSNTEQSGRYHTNWLNMMYPRLKLARNLLQNDGVIFISIDDNELNNLKKICDEIFGEENCLGIIANINNPKGRSDDKFIATAHEYIVVYSKDSRTANLYGFDPDEKITKRYNKLDEKGRRFREIDLRKTGDSDKRSDRPDMFYYFYYDKKKDLLRISKDQSGGKEEIEITPVKNDGSDGRWRWGYNTALEKINNLYAKLMPSRKIWGIFEKDFLEGRPPVKATSCWTFKDVNSERGSEQFIGLGFDKEVFQRPKPLGTLKRVLEVGTNPDEKSIVLDFFAGSAGIAQAVFKLVSAGKRDFHFIVVQLPEPCNEKSEAFKTGYKSIADIGKERIRRAGDKILVGNKDQEGIENLDIGFKVFKLDSSNIKPWDADFDHLEDALWDSVNNIKTDRTEADVLYELLLKYGLDLTLPIEERDINGKKVFLIGLGALVICLDSDITIDVVEGIGKLKEELDPEIMRVVFRDSGFKDDVVKTNAIQILKKYNIEDVKSL